jgi:hypothetical protein
VCAQVLKCSSAQVLKCSNPQVLKCSSAQVVTGYGLRVTGYGLRVTGYGLRVTGTFSEVQGSGLGLWIPCVLGYTPHTTHNYTSRGIEVPSPTTKRKIDAVHPRQRHSTEARTEEEWERERERMEGKRQGRSCAPCLGGEVRVRD